MRKIPDVYVSMDEYHNYNFVPDGGGEGGGDGLGDGEGTGEGFMTGITGYWLANRRWNRLKALGDK